MDHITAYHDGRDCKEKREFLTYRTLAGNARCNHRTLYPGGSIGVSHSASSTVDKLPFWRTKMPPMTKVAGRGPSGSGSPGGIQEHTSDKQ